MESVCSRLFVLAFALLNCAAFVQAASPEQEQDLSYSELYDVAKKTTSALSGKSSLSDEEQSSQAWMKAYVEIYEASGNKASLELHTFHQVTQLQQEIQTRIKTIVTARDLLEVRIKDMVGSKGRSDFGGLCYVAAHLESEVSTLGKNYKLLEKLFESIKTIKDENLTKVVDDLALIKGVMLRGTSEASDYAEGLKKILKHCKEEETYSYVDIEKASRDVLRVNEFVVQSFVTPYFIEVDGRLTQALASRLVEIIRARSSESAPSILRRDLDAGTLPPAPYQNKGAH